MAINIFEGARRITKLIAAIWIIGWLVAAFNVSPSTSVTYQIARPGAVPVLTTEKCPSDSATEYDHKETKSGTKAWVTLCFLAITADDGSKVIPYRADPVKSQWWVERKYSSEVSEYTHRIATSFSIPPSDEARIDSQWWPSFLKELGQGALGAIGGLLFLWAFAWTMGWIVRGFMGIPRGSDCRK